ncbi:hypothetical protein ACFLV7_08705 [Chloroflexota bacterium]
MTLAFSNNLNDLVSVIIRSAGERTEQLCKELIIEQGVSPDNLFIVKEAPFSAALKTAFELGIERGLKWTLCNDADVLLRPGAVKNMIALAEQQDENVCGIEGFILDKFTSGPRKGGVHLYRSSVLLKALEYIPPEGLDIRPETHTQKALAAIGYPWKVVQYLVGIHDFEQYYKDIFRKCFVHAHKHLDLTELYLSVWREKATSDMDYVVALRGFASGVEHYGEVFIDSRQEIYQALVSELQLQEKQALALEKYSLASIEEIINNWEIPKSYRERYPTYFHLLSDELPKTQRFLQTLAYFGIIMIFPYTIGWVFQAAGNRLKDWARSSRKPIKINWIKNLYTEPISKNNK